MPSMFKFPSDIWLNAYILDAVPLVQHCVEYFI